MTPQESQDLGRIARKLGFEMDNRYSEFAKWEVEEFEDHTTSRVIEVLPDFRCQLTALACIPWVRKAYSGYIVEASWSMSFASLRVLTHTGEILFARTDAPTIAHACVEAVKAVLEDVK